MRRRLVVLVAIGLAGLAAPAGAGAAGWCGKGEVRANRPDLAGGRQIRVLYVIPDDGEDRFAQMAPRIADDLTRVEAWWRREDPTRAPRFDLAAFPDCAGMGRLDIGFVRLPQTADEFLEPQYRLAQLGIYLDLAGVTSSVADSYRKFLVYYDGPVEFGDVCGDSFIRPRAGGGVAVTGVWARADPTGRGCGTIGRGGYAALVAAHELIHNLGGAVPGKSPHECADEPGHVCDNPHDIMYGERHPFLLLSQNRLDVGHDDYYGHSGDWWDVQDSEWLYRLDAPDVKLSVQREGGHSSDTVTSDVPGIECGPVCETSLESGTTVTLTAKAGKGSRFVRWTGACTGTGPCALPMGRSSAVQAVFVATTYRMTVRVSGHGRVATGGFSCAATCSKPLAAGGSYAFRAIAAKGWRFVGWTGACRGHTPCRVGLTGDRTLRALFRRR